MTSTPLRRALCAAPVLVAVLAVAPAAASASTWTVDDDRAQCPNAAFTSVQEAIDQAAPHDTVVICDGLYREASPAPPYGNAQSYVQPGARSAVTITKPLTIRGAGADKVTIEPAAALGDTLAGTQPYLRDGGGNVITVSRQSLGSSDDNENFTDISGITVASPDAYVEAGIAFFNTSGRVSKSVVGPLRRAGADVTATRPHGWGIVETNSLQSAVLGGIRREVTVEDSLVDGFGAGGVLFDSSVGGADGAATNTTRSNVNTYGRVIRTKVVGEKGGASVSQTGVRFQSGARGEVTDSEVLDTWGGTSATARSAVGVLLADAETGQDPTNTAVRALTISGTTFGGNGYAVYNADAANSAVRNGAPALVKGDYWGCANGAVRTTANVLGAASNPTTLCQGGSGNDAGTPANPAATPPAAAVPAAPSLITEAGTDADPFRTTPAVNLAVPAKTTDAAPTAAIAEPVSGTVVPVGTTISPVVQASDDFGVRSVSFTAGGAPVATLSKRPYEFSFTPTAAQAGTTVPLVATVTDSAGQTTTASVDVVVPPPPVAPGGGAPAAPGTPGTPAGPAAPGAPATAVGRTVRIVTKRVRLDRQGRFAVRASCSRGTGSCRMRLLVRRGTSIVGTKTITVKPGASATVRFRPTAAMRRSLRRGRTVTVKASLSGAGIRATSANVKVLPRKG